MRNFLNEHRKNIISEKIGKKADLESGHIVMFNYSGKNVKTKRPLVLVLNPNYNGKLHGLKLDAIPEDVLQKLYSIVRETKLDRFRKLIKLRLPLLSSDIQNPKKFYETKIKSFLNRHLPRREQTPYRTYDSSEITSLRIVDYRFKDYYTGEESSPK